MQICIQHNHSERQHIGRISIGVPTRIFIDEFLGKFFHNSVNFLRLAGEAEMGKEPTESLIELQLLEVHQLDKGVETLQVERLVLPHKLTYSRLV